MNYLFLHMCSGYRRTNEKVITGKGIALFTHTNTATDYSDVYPRAEFLFCFLFYLVVMIIIIVLLCFIIKIINNPLTAGKINLYIFRILSNKIMNILYF